MRRWDDAERKGIRKKGKVVRKGQGQPSVQVVPPASDVVGYTALCNAISILPLL